MEIGERIRYLREAQHLDKQALADAAGMSRNAIYLIETNRRKPSSRSLEKIARGLGVPIAQLFSDEPVEVSIVPAGKAKAPAPGPEDPTDRLLALLEATARAYHPVTGITLDWDAGTYDHLSQSLGAAAVEAAAIDAGAGREDRAVAILHAFAQSHAHLQSRKAQLEVAAESTDQPEKGQHLDLAEADAVLRQLQTLDAA